MLLTATNRQVVTGAEFMANVKIKGRVLVDTVASITARIGKAELDKLLNTLDGPSQRTLRDGIAIGEWYPLEVMTALMVADVSAHDGGNESVVVSRAEAVVAKQLSGIYRIFVRLGSPESIIKRISAVHETYFQGVQIAQEFVGQRKALVRYKGFGKEHRIMEHVIVGFYRKALEMSGARNIEARFTTPISAGKDIAELAITWT
jgi:hypothetical protein